MIANGAIMGRSQPPTGTRDKRHAKAAKQIAIRFDDEAFARIERIAAARHLSFASVVRLLVTAGLAVREQGLMRPAEVIQARDAA